MIHFSLLKTYIAQEVQEKLPWKVGNKHTYLYHDPAKIMDYTNRKEKNIL